MKHLFRKEDGSITLEAAMVLPFFMLFIVFLAMLIRLAVADMALYKAASETSEILVSYAYPADVVKSTATDFINNKIQSIEREHDVNLSEAMNWANEGMKFYGIDISTSIENYFESLAPSKLDPIMQEKFKQATGNWNFFNPENVKVTKVELPGLVGGSGKFLEINVQYKFDLSVPFVEKTILLKKTSYERLWNGS
ncbi:MULTISPECIES: TadE family protein [unclassified Virgibacillus]|uniref:TadE/TadG family type IV pilus assembly protein n=1 Tax=unclassified Virgibacillus TaxID=2620237 RepID=UPI0024DE7D16|nr:TadE family protein [Virgibacillus sp. LDC-1]